MVGTSNLGLDSFLISINIYDNSLSRKESLFIPFTFISKRVKLLCPILLCSCFESLISGTAQRQRLENERNRCRIIQGEIESKRKKGIEETGILKKEKKKNKEYLSSSKEDSQDANFNFIIYKYICIYLYIIVLISQHVYENRFLIDKIRRQGRGKNSLTRKQKSEREKHDGEHDKVKFVT